MGRSPLPRRILEIRGTVYRREQKLRFEPIPDPGEPVRPSYFTTEQRAVWDQVVAALKVTDILFRTDFGVLERYCVMLCQWRHLQTRIATKESDSWESMVRLSLRLDSALKQLESVLALSPGARAKIGSIPREVLAGQAKANGRNYFDRAAV